MNFFKNNKNYVLIALTSLFVIFSTLIFIQIIYNASSLLSSINSIIYSFIDLLSPFIIGFSIAFILNSPARKLNNLLLKYNIFPKKRCKIFSLLITYILFFGFFIFIIRLIIPTIMVSVYQLAIDIYDFILVIQGTLQKTINTNNTPVITDFIEKFNLYTNSNFDINGIFNSILKPLLNWIYNLPELMSQLLTSIVTIISVVFDSILAIMISFYFLMDKDIFINFGRKTTRVLFSKNASNRILYISSVTNSIFQKFLIGKALDSLIIGFLFFIALYIFNIPYSLLFSFIIGITNMIPYFGPFIGAIPVVGLLLIIDVKLAFIALIIILVLQQFDGIYLGPKILGESTGVRPIGIIFAVTIGGRLFGALGMLLGVPIFAVLSYFFNEFIENKSKQKLLLEDKKEYYTNKVKNGEL